MKHTIFHEAKFQKQVSNALDSVARILDAHRNPRLAEDVDHQYADKYALSEVLTNTTIAAQMNILERMGLTRDKLSRLYNMVKTAKRSATFAFKQKCTSRRNNSVVSSCMIRSM